MNIKSTISTNLKALMEERGTTVVKISEITGVSIQQTYKYLRGVNALPHDKIVILAKYFKKDVNFFFTSH